MTQLVQTTIVPNGFLGLFVYKSASGAMSCYIQHAASLPDLVEGRGNGIETESTKPSDIRRDMVLLTSNLVALGLQSEAA